MWGEGGGCQTAAAVISYDIIFEAIASQYRCTFSKSVSIFVNFQTFFMEISGKKHRWHEALLHNAMKWGIFLQF